MASEQNRNIPNLFLVGAPKCGTTSLHLWLSQHPEIFMSREKEPWFLCTDKRREADEYNGRPTPEFKYRTEKDYFSLFEKASTEKYIGESSTKYFISEEAVENIYRLNQKASIIIALRDPIDFLRSTHSEAVKGGIENIENFEKALREEENRKQHQNMPNKVVCPSDLFYTEQVRFSEYIKNYQKYFPNEQIKIVVLEEIKKDPINIYQEILNFLKVDDIQFTPEFNIYNSNAKIRSKRLNNFIKNSKYVKQTVRSILPDTIRKKITSALENLNKRTAQRPPLSAETKKELMVKLEPEVEKLIEITGKDLKTMWGYNNIPKE
jgi:hypothetical protein